MHSERVASLPYPALTAVSQNRFNMARSLRQQLESEFGALDADDAVDDALRAQLAEIEAAKNHLSSIRLHASTQVDSSNTELRSLGLAGVIDADLLPSDRLSAAPRQSVLESHGLLDPTRLMQRAVDAAQPAWPEWGFPEAAYQSWEASFGKGLGMWFRGFLFEPGMLFGSEVLWWPPHKRRQAPHEGLDYQLFADPSGGSHPVPPGTPVPSILPGVVVASFQDFIRSTCIVKHDVKRDGRVLHSVFGHVAPAVRVGVHLSAGAIMGKVGANPKSAAPAHLHLSAAWLEEGHVPPESWKELIDRAIFGCPAAVSAAQLHGESEEERAAHQTRVSLTHGSYAARIGGDARAWRGSPAKMLRGARG